jgi:drug/metabolite transporter (DMT)-like permease
MTRKLGYLCIAITTLIWAVNPVVFKSLSYYTTENIQNFVRFLTAYIILSIYAKFFIQGKEKANDYKRVSVWNFVVPGFLLYITNEFFITGITLSKANISAFVMEGIGPIITIIVFSLFIIEERKALKNRYVQAAILAALIGSFLVMVNLKTSLSTSFDIGAFLVLIGAILWSFFSLVVKKDFKGFPAVIFLRNSMGIGTILFFITIIFTKEIFVLYGVNFYILLNMMFPGVLAFISSIAFYKGIIAVPAINANLIFLLGPIITVLISKLILNEMLTVQQVIGCSLVFIANVLLLYFEVRDQLNANKSE